MRAVLLGELMLAALGAAVAVGAEVGVGPVQAVRHAVEFHAHHAGESRAAIVVHELQERLPSAKLPRRHSPGVVLHGQSKPLYLLGQGVETVRGRGIHALRLQCVRYLFLAFGKVAEQQHHRLRGLNGLWKTAGISHIVLVCPLKPGFHCKVIGVEIHHRHRNLNLNVRRAIPRAVHKFYLQRLRHKCVAHPVGIYHVRYPGMKLHPQHALSHAWRVAHNMNLSVVLVAVGAYAADARGRERVGSRRSPERGGPVIARPPDLLATAVPQPEDKVKVRFIVDLFHFANIIIIRVL